VEEIKEEDWTRNISRYVLPPIGEDIPPLPDAIADFKATLARVRQAEDHLRTVMATFLEAPSAQEGEGGEYA
jgi:type I restriction enzyme M protein